MDALETCDALQKKSSSNWLSKTKIMAFVHKENMTVSSSPEILHIFHNKKKTLLLGHSHSGPNNQETPCKCGYVDLLDKTNQVHIASCTLRTITSTLVGIGERRMGCKHTGIDLEPRMVASMQRLEVYQYFAGIGEAASGCAVCCTILTTM
jgi:hypothetical protein